MNATEVMAAIEKLPVEEQDEVLAWLARRTIARHEFKRNSRNGKYSSPGDSGGMELRENRERMGISA